MSHKDKGYYYKLKVSMIMIAIIMISIIFIYVKKTSAEKSPDNEVYSHIGDNVLNVKQFGAAGDGVLDDTFTIQHAFNNLVDGQTLYFPPGEYKISDTLQFYGRNNIRILGYKAKIMMMNSAKNVIRLGNGSGSASIRYHIRGLDIDGGSTTGYAIGVDAGGGTYMQNCLIQDCYIHNCGVGIYLGGDNNSILDNTFESCTKAGILNDCSSYALISGNTLKSCFNAINLQLPYYNKVLNNHMFASSNFGVLIGGTPNSEVHCLIADNIISGANNSVNTGLTGIWVVAGVCKVEINHNKVFSCGQHGIKSLGNDVSIIDNCIYNNINNGLMVDNCSRNILVDNECYNNGLNGIEIVNYGKNHLILDNHCYDNQTPKTQAYGLSIVETQTGCIVQGNNFTNNKLSGVTDKTYNHSDIIYRLNVDGRK